MNYRAFGGTSLRVSEIGFGCSQLGSRFEPDDARNAIKILHRAFDLGINFYDTADIYAQGRSEELLGEALKGKRTNVVIASKAGFSLTAAGSFAARLKPLVRPLINILPGVKRRIRQAGRVLKAQDFSPDHLRKAIDESLHRLQTDYIDVFQLHSPPSPVIETGEFVEVLERAQSQGKIRWYGVSCRTIDDAFVCLRYPGVSSVQIEISLMKFQGVSSFLESARRNNVAVIARQPLASGFLSLRITMLKPERFPLGQQEFEEALEKAKPYQFLAEGSQRTMAQAALRFVLQLPGVSVVLVGMSSAEHLNENLTAPAYPLSSDELARISRVHSMGRQNGGKTDA